MSSRVLLLLSLILTLAGCKLPIYENPPQGDPMIVDLGMETACLSRVVPVIEVFFDGVAKDAQIQATWSCLETSLKTFEKSVSGRYEDRFTARELAHFFEQYFLDKGTRIPDPMLVEIFRIKQLFVGGELQSISRTEIKNLLEVIDELERITLMLNPYMKIYALQWGEARSAARDLDRFMFESANEAIQRSMKDLSLLIKRNGMPYDIRNVVTLLKEVEKFSQKSWAWIATVEKAMPLVQKLKKTLTGGDESVIAPTEWEIFALLSARGYVQYLRYFYFIKNSSLTAGGAALDYLIDSIRDLFSYLGDMVALKPTAKLTRAELLEILQALSDFVPNVKISDQLLVEAMKVKVVLFGGDINYFEKADFDKAKDKLNDFKDLTDRILLYSKVYTLKWKPESSAQPKEYFKRADEYLLQVGQLLGRNLDSAYDLKDLITLAEEIDRLYEFKFLGENKLAQVAHKYVPVIIALKNIVLSDTGSLIGQLNDNQNRKPRQQWSLFFEFAANGFSRVLYYEYFLKEKSWTRGEGLQNFDQLVKDANKLLENLIDKKPSLMISLAEVGRLIEAVKGTDLLPAKVSATSLKSLARILVQRVLIQPKHRLEGVVPLGLTKSSLAILMEEFDAWFKTQEYLNLIYKDVGSNQGKSGAQILADLKAATDTKETWWIREMIMIYDNPIALSFDEKGRWYISKPALNYLHSTSTTVNVVRLGVRLMIRSYASSLDRINSYNGITEAEANDLFIDIRQFVVELELISKSNEEFATKRFRDANLFSAVGNGDELVNFKEGANLFMMILSGIKVDDLIYDKLTQHCDILKPTNYKFDWKVDQECAKRVYQAFIPTTFDSMPELVEFHQGLSDERFEKLFGNLLKAAGADLASSDVKIEDIGLYAHVVQYVEGVFLQFDLDGDGLLSTSEAMQAYPRYRAILQQVSGLKVEKELRGLFAWLLKKGKPPTGLEQLDFKFKWCKMEEEQWQVSANREMLATILGFIADATKPGRNVKPLFSLEHEY